MIIIPLSADYKGFLHIYFSGGGKEDLRTGGNPSNGRSVQRANTQMFSQATQMELLHLDAQDHEVHGSTHL